MAEEWYAKGKEVCGYLLEEAEQALKEAEAREDAEAKVWINESQCEELAGLAKQAEKQATLETEPEPLIKLAEEMKHRKDTMESLGQLLKETIPAEFKERAQQAVKDSVQIVEEGKRWLGRVRARLKFRSADSEAGSYRGPMGAGVAADPWRRNQGGAPEERSRAAEGSMSTTDGLASLLRGWGQLTANDSGWPTFDGRFASYPPFKKEWTAYRETYHSVVNDDLAAKTLRESA